MHTLLDLLVPDDSKVPIRTLGHRHRPAMLAHLLELDPQDRYLRFGHSPNDAQLAAYVDGIDWRRDEVFGIYNRGLKLLAWAHLAHPRAQDSAQPWAEFGVSVRAAARGRGYGSMLFDRAVVHARNEGLNLLLVHALSENAAMLHIARRAGASLERHGPETEAFLRLPPANLDSHMGELFDEQYAQTDYRIKRQAQRIRAVFQGVQNIQDGLLGRGRNSG